MAPQYMAPQMMMPAPTDANDVAAADDGAATADDGAATADDGANGTIVSHCAAATIGLAANAAVGPVSTVLCWIWDGIPMGENF